MEVPDTEAGVCNPAITEQNMAQGPEPDLGHNILKRIKATSGEGEKKNPN